MIAKNLMIHPLCTENQEGTQGGGGEQISCEESSMSIFLVIKGGGEFQKANEGKRNGGRRPPPHYLGRKAKSVSVTEANWVAVDRYHALISGIT